MENRKLFEKCFSISSSALAEAGAKAFNERFSAL
jgi:hypothetical protein